MDVDAAFVFHSYSWICVLPAHRNGHAQAEDVPD